MSLPESFDKKSFDSVDLWRVTQNLAARLPGLHVARIIAPTHQRRNGTPFLRAYLHSQDVNGVRAEFHNADILGPLEELHPVLDRIRNVMGKAVTYDEFTNDADPFAAANPDAQRGIARTFLPYIGKMSITNALRKEESVGASRMTCSVPLIQVNRQEDGRSTRENIQTLAKANVQLAMLADEDPAPYEAIAAQAAFWTPADSIPASLKWLAPPVQQGQRTTPG